MKSMPSLTGTFLVARPVLVDSNFSQTVVLILSHGEEGAYGFVVNRPLPAKDLPLPVYSGGPCESPGMIMLHGHVEWVETGEGGSTVGNREVIPGVYIGDAECMSRASTPTPGLAFRYRIFEGYSGWGPGQLEQEIAAGAWTLAPATAQLLFDIPPEDLWSRLRPRTIPEPSVN
jgi:putative transcriptional regulator